MNLHDYATSEIHAAITLSIGHDVIVRVDIAGDDIDLVLASVGHDGISEENDGYWDVWGTRNGQEWRLLITLRPQAAE